MADWKTYRHKVTGLVSKIAPETALVFAHVLKEVEEGAKPLAYVSLPAVPAAVSLPPEVPTAPTHGAHAAETDPQ